MLIRTLGLIGLFALGACAQEASDASGKIDGIYVVEYNSSSPREIRVEATFPRHTGVLNMDWRGAEFIENGWATFVENLQVSNKEGQSLGVEFQKGGRWTISGNAEGPITANYRIRIGHDDIVWDAGGHDEGAYALSDLTFIMGRGVFMTPDHAEEDWTPRDYRVEFRLGDGDQVVVPWAKLARATYQVSTTEMLVGVPMQLGKLRISSMEEGGAKVSVATGAEFSGFADVILPHFEGLLSILPERLGQIDTSEFVIHANRAPVTDAIDPYFSGGAFPLSMSLIGPEVPSPEMLPILTYMVSHEFAHLWNSVAFGFADTEREYWFSEGITDYITVKTLLDMGVFSVDDFLNGPLGLASNYQKYLAVAGSKSLREAGLEKFENYDLVYSGGFVVAIWLDATLRSQHSPARIEDVVRTLVEGRASVPNGYSHAQLREVIAGHLEDAEAFNVLASRSIEGSEVIDLKDILNTVGLAVVENDGAFQIAIRDEDSVLLGDR